MLKEIFYKNESQNLNMTTKVNIKLTQKGSNFREVSFSTNHPINLVEMWMKTRVWDGIINKWMLERNT